MAPFLGPSTIEPIITGIWTMVALITTKGIKPNGVKPNTNTMPIAQDRGTLHLIYSIYIPPAAAHKDAAQIPFYYTEQIYKMQ